MNSEKIIIVGRTASGKNYLCDWFEAQGFRKSIMHTTRPMRDGEIDGDTYHYVSEDMFKQMINNDEFYEWDNFIGWYYGSTKKDFIDSRVFIKTPNGVSKLTTEDRQNCFIIYLDLPDEILLERLSKRMDSNDSIQRRIQTDTIDFMNYTEYDLRITDSDYDPEFILSLIN